MSQKLTPKKARAILRGYDWLHALIFLFPLKTNAPDAEGELQLFIERESDTWCGDDDDDGTELTPSYIAIGTLDNGMQGPAFTSSSQARHTSWRRA
jgi:hypothetical protein